MCGIFVVVSKRLALGDVTSYIEATRSMSSRGPDDIQYWYDDRVFLGHSRLAIVDAEGGKQPVFNEDESIYGIVNGEFYDHISIANKLKGLGHQLNSESDAEILCHMYEEEGADFIEKLDGMFATVLYDRKKQTLLVARDRFGIKPLVCYEDDNIILYCSSIATIASLLPSKSRTINRDAVRQFLIMGYLPPDSTLINGLNVFPAATHRTVSIHDGTSDDFEYWRPDFSPEASLDNTGKAIFQRLTKETIKTIPEVPFAFYLSGGIDSSLVYKAAKRPDDIALSLRFNDRYDEGEFQQQVCENTIDIPFPTEYYTAGTEQFRRSIIALEQPQIFALDSPMQLLASSASKRGAKVVLTGDGADELLGGYDHFQALAVGLSLSSQLQTPKTKKMFCKYLMRMGFPDDYNNKLIYLLENKSNQEKGLGMLLPWSVVWDFSEEISTPLIKKPSSAFWLSPTAYLIPIIVSN